MEFDKIWFISKNPDFDFFSLFVCFVVVISSRELLGKLGELVNRDLYLSHLYFLNFICFALCVLGSSSSERAAVAGRDGGQGSCPEPGPGWGSPLPAPAPSSALVPMLRPAWGWGQRSGSGSRRERSESRISRLAGCTTSKRSVHPAA